MYCLALTEANYPLVTSTGHEAFAECTSLTSVNLPSVTYIDDSFLDCSSLTSITIPNVIEIGYAAFGACSSATTFNTPLATILGNFAFQECFSITTLNLSSCTNLGETVGDNGVFGNIVGNTITLTVPAALMTCDGGNPDGDIVYLQANNTVTIITV
jgi:hypothetical protein